MYYKLDVSASIAMALLCAAFVESADAGVNEWTSQGPSGGHVVALAIDPATPSTLYAATVAGSGGVYKSTDGGARWKGVNTGLPGASVYALAIDPAAPSTVYCGTDGGGVYKTSDGGDHWDGTHVGTPSGRVAALAIDPAFTSTIYAGTSYVGTGGVFKSIDGGENWVDASNGLGHVAVAALAIDPSNPSILYAGTDGSGVYKSTDGGAYWTAINSGLTHGIVRALAIDPIDPNTVYAGGFGVYKSTDGGDQWAAVDNGLDTDGGGVADVQTLAIDPTAPSTIYAGAAWACGEVYKSTDGGATWEVVAGNCLGVETGLDEPDVLALAIDPSDSAIVYAGATDSPGCIYYSAGVFKSIDGGTTWAVSNTGLSSTSIQALAIDPTTPSTLFAGIDFGGLGQTTDGAATWSADGGDVSVTALAIDPSAPSVLYLAGSGDCVSLPSFWLSRIDDAGRADVSLEDDVPTRQLLIDPLTPATLYAVTGPHYEGSGAVYRSSNRGDDWTAVTTGLPETGVTVLAIDRSTPRALYAGTRDGVFKTIDGGDSWVAANFGAHTRIEALAIDPGEPQVLYAGTGAGVLKSSDAGASWFSAGLQDTAVTAFAIDPLDPSIVYAGTSDGVFKSMDGGDPWEPFNTGLQNARARALVIDPLSPSKLFAATARGVFDVTQVDVCDGTTLCLHQERFRVDLEWRSFDDTTGSGRAVPFGSDDSGLLWFFEADNWELLIKVLDGCAFNDRFWVFAAATTTVEYTLRVTDTQVGTVREYFNPLGTAAAAITDTDAFAACPTVAAGSAGHSPAFEGIAPAPISSGLRGPGPLVRDLSIGGRP